MNFSNSYLGLGSSFYKKEQPTAVQAPQLFLWNSQLAEQLLVSNDYQQDPITLAEIFSGNRILSGSEPIATAYAGHQFGNFVPQLGDGRAHLLGEVLDQYGKGWDIQLKGSGPTFFSRGGDGRCAIGPAVREFIMSEAMDALGIPTTRSLAVVTTGEPVFRETVLPGAVVTRVASSHIRVGTFQYFAARGDFESLKNLCDYVIERHYPELEAESPQRYIKLIDTVIEKQIRLVVEWMRVGFIHGVMNTDNTSVAGETIDYGPCAMMGVYNPGTVYSSIDRMGRYAFANQPTIMQWNMARFSECLLPLIDTDSERAIEQVQPLIVEFGNRFKQAYLQMLGRKLGLIAVQPEDEKLLFSFLNCLELGEMDYTITFDRLTKSLNSEAISDQIKEAFGEDYDLWRLRLNQQDVSIEEIYQIMKHNNPVVIPRNHHMEAVIEQCETTRDVTKAENFLKVLRSPYQEIEETSQYQDLPLDGDKYYQTFCGT